MDYPKLRTPLLAFIIAALCVALVLKARFLPDWLRLFLTCLAFILGFVGIITLGDWIAHNFAERIKEINRARTLGLVLVSNALRDMSPDTAAHVLALDTTYISMIAEETGPVFFVRCLSRDVPFVFVEDFLEKSRESDPFLWPVRESGNKEYAQALTNLIIARGWADKAEGPLSAKLIKPLPWVAGKFGVELGS